MTKQSKPQHCAGIDTVQLIIVSSQSCIDALYMLALGTQAVGQQQFALPGYQVSSATAQ
ncbi:hypothetical protein D3C81_1783090 [compost metagenome]